MNLTSYVLDDDRHAIDAVLKHLEKTPELTCIGTNTDPIIALSEIKLKQPELVFLDVEMPELSGIEVAGLLPENTFVVFITSHSKYAIEAIQKDAIGYLLKPFSYHQFAMCLDKIKARINKTDKEGEYRNLEKIFINSGTKGKLNQIPIAEILYIEAVKHVQRIYTHTEDYRSRVSIRSIEALLPITKFVRVHRSYIINIDLIKSVEGNTVTLLNDAVVPFGDSYKNHFMDSIKSRTVKG